MTRSPRCPPVTPLVALAAYLGALATILACAPVELSGVASQEQSEPVNSCAPQAPGETRPDEYAMSPLPEVLWSYRSDVGSDFAPAIAGDSLIVATGINQMYSLEKATGQLRWLREVAGVASAPPVVLDGVVYVSGEFWDEHIPRTGVVFALDASSGEELWRYDIPRGSWNELWADPVLANGMVYVGSFNGRMYALDAGTGELRWSFAAGDVIRGSAVVVQDTVYFGSKDHHIYALAAPTGVLRWQYETDGEVWIGPVVSAGLVLQGPGDEHLHALDASTGELRWRYTAGSGRWSRPVMINGTVYATVNEDLSEFYQQGSNLEQIRHHGSAVALDARTGRLLWEYRTAGDASDPVIVDGVVYLVASDERSYLSEDALASGNIAMRGYVYALDAANGDLIWHRRAVSEVIAGLRGLTVADGTVYVKSYDQIRYRDPRSPPMKPFHGQLSAFDAETGETVWLFEVDDYFSEPPTVHQGVAYVASLNGQVCALRASP